MTEEKKLTDKQKAFVYAYCGEARYNATRAAAIAGYKSAKQSGTECLASSSIRKAIDEHFALLQDEALRDRRVRVKRLTEMVEDLDAIQEARAQAAREAVGRGEQVPKGALLELYRKSAKMSGNGAKVIEEWVLGRTLINERRSLKEQIAKEVGDHINKTEIAGKDGGSIKIEDVTSAKDKLTALLGD